MTSQWCALRSVRLSVYETGSSEERVEYISGHDWCAQQRWHDEHHGKDPGCCASPEERESWACDCSCHEKTVATDVSG